MLRQVDMYVNGRPTYAAADDSPYKYDLDGDGIDEAYECELNPATGLPVHEADYAKYRGFRETYTSHLSRWERTNMNRGIQVFLWVLYMRLEEFRKLISIFIPNLVSLPLRL